MIFAVLFFPLRDRSRPRARWIRTNATRDLVEPRCEPPTTRPEHTPLFPPTTGFYFWRVIFVALFAISISVLPRNLLRMETAEFESNDRRDLVVHGSGLYTLYDAASRALCIDPSVSP